MLRRLIAAVTMSASLFLPAWAPNAAPLAVEFATSPTLDASCGLVRGYAIESDWRAELDDRHPAMQAAWSRDGRSLLDVALRLAGERLHGDHRVRLTLCDLPSSSRLGAVVNMRHALASFTDRPVPLRYKAMIASHELLHGALADLDLTQSRLLTAHEREERRVRDHLHLLALMKAALIELDRHDLLAELRRIDGSLPGGTYRRAWAIVDATPDAYLAYVDEIRDAR